MFALFFKELKESYDLSYAREEIARSNSSNLPRSARAIIIRSSAEFKVRILFVNWRIIGIILGSIPFFIMIIVGGLIQGFQEDINPVIFSRRVPDFLMVILLLLYFVFSIPAGWLWGSVLARKKLETRRSNLRSSPSEG